MKGAYTWRQARRAAQTPCGAAAAAPMRAPAGAAGSYGCRARCAVPRAGRARCDRRVAQRVDVDAAPVAGAR